MPGLKSRRARSAGIAVVILTLSLTACSGKTLKFGGQEVEDLDKTITALDDSWKQSLTDGKKANTAPDDGSRCYAQINGEVLADEAICGPVHYLGSDDTTWDTVSLKQVLDNSSDKVRVEKDSGFTTGAKKANVELYRPDGKEPPSDLNVPEPEANTEEPGQAIWMKSSGPQAPGDSSTGDSSKSVTIVTPDARLVVSSPKISDRIGGPEDRQQAGAGNKFGSVTISTGANGSSQSDSKTVLAFSAGGKSYNVGKPQDGTLAMAVPGDGKDLALTVTFEGKTQTYSLADGSLDEKSKGLSYYDGYKTTSDDSAKVGDLKIEKQNGFDLTFYGTSYTAYRVPYDASVGWAPEGKSWLVISGSPSTDSLQWKPDHGYEYGYYNVKEDIVSGTVTNVSGEAFKTTLKAHPRVEGSGWFSSDRVNAIFEVPAKARDFKASFVLRATGTLKKDQSNTEAPATANFDSPVNDLQFTFPQGTDAK
ncbi:hypothetical protein QFZ52_002469 [Arthrobacter woluwensis]|nr:hypothetical protein [Arthrobacter woluwensis]